MDTTPHLRNSMTRDELAALPPLLSVKQASELGVGSTRTVRRMCERHALKARKVGSMWRINRDSVIEYFDLLDYEEEYRRRQMPRPAERKARRSFRGDGGASRRTPRTPSGYSELLDGLELIG